MKFPWMQSIVFCWLLPAVLFAAADPDSTQPVGEILYNGIRHFEPGKGDCHLYSFWVSRDPSGSSGGFVAAGGPEFVSSLEFPVVSKRPRVQRLACILTQEEQSMIPNPKEFQ